MAFQVHEMVDRTIQRKIGVKRNNCASWGEVFVSMSWGNLPYPRYRKMRKLYVIFRWWHIMIWKTYNSSASNRSMSLTITVIISLPLYLQLNALTLSIFPLSVFLQFLFKRQITTQRRDLPWPLDVDNTLNPDWQQKITVQNIYKLSCVIKVCSVQASTVTKIASTHTPNSKFQSIRLRKQVNIHDTINNVSKIQNYNVSSKRSYSVIMSIIDINSLCWVI